MSWSIPWKLERFNFTKSLKLWRLHARELQTDWGQRNNSSQGGVGLSRKPFFDSLNFGVQATAGPRLLVPRSRFQQLTPGVRLP
jgi:hypothetical protein